MSNDTKKQQKPPRIFRFLRKADGTRINQEPFKLIQWSKKEKPREGPKFEELERRIL